MKECTKCKVSQEIIEFVKDRNKKDGLCSSCNDCRRRRLGQKKNNSIRFLESKTRFWRCWNSAKQRCNNKNDSSYQRYGGRGIKCEWEYYEYFRKDMYESYLYHLNKYGEMNTTIDRIDSNGNYCKENCRWATQLVQGRNRRSVSKYLFRGSYITIGEISKIVGIKHYTLYSRIKYCGYTIDEAISKKMHENSGRKKNCGTNIK